MDGFELEIIKDYILDVLFAGVMIALCDGFYIKFGFNAIFNLKNQIRYWCFIVSVEYISWVLNRVLPIRSIPHSMYWILIIAIAIFISIIDSRRKKKYYMLPEEPTLMQHHKVELFVCKVALIILVIHMIYLVVIHFI